MAAGSTALPMKLELPSTPVQELINSNGNHIPERYVFYPNTNSSSKITDGTVLPSMESPIIDLQLLLDTSSLHGKQELLKLRSVLTSWGCFHLVNHGIASSLLDQIRGVCKEFFALPLEEKQKYSRSVDWFEGYGNDVVAEGQPINWNDRLYLKIYPVEQRNLKLWPENLTNFRETLHEYAIGVKQVQEVTLKAIARSLNLEENDFFGYFEEGGIQHARINCYPPCPCPDRVLGFKPHSDGTLITILLQDKEVESLQVLKDDQWFKVPIVHDALFINVGDILEIMSNGILKSPVHKVVIDKERQRISVAVRSSLLPDKEFGPLPELIDKDRPRLYKNVKDYFPTFLQYYTRGERAITALRISDQSA